MFERCLLSTYCARHFALYPPFMEFSHSFSVILRNQYSCGIGGNGKPLQCSCLGSPMDRRAWQATVHGVAKTKVHKHNKFALKLPNRIRIHTQVCLTQAHGYSSARNVSRAVRRVVTSYLTRDSHKSQYFSDIFLRLHLMICYKSVGPQGDLSLGRSELCLFLATVFPHLLEVITI